MRAAPCPASVEPAPLPDPADSAAAETEFEFETRDFERVRQLILQRAGIHLHAGKRAMVYSRVSRRLRETGHRSFGAYLAGLEQGAGGAPEWQEFVNCLTTNLTGFFREEHHFEMLADALRSQAHRPLRIWCGAASTGEEPYSIAMTVAEALGPQTSACILASDIDTKVLATAAQGIYSADARGLTLERRRLHCQRGVGSYSGQMRIKPELARMIEFRTHNLTSSPWHLGEPFDVVFCRNVMIYFNAATQRRVLERIHAVLRPGGWLFVGHSENFSDARALFRLRGKTVYERL